ncbi:peptide chain release factor N(5)-glutamine methyltransferase [Calidifontibacter terrae]
MNPRAALRAAAARLVAAGIPGGAVDARRLLESVLRIDAADLDRRIILGPDLTTPELSRFQDLVDERARRIPLQHLTGRAPFRRLELHVGPGVFVPRPETESIVDLALNALPMGGTVVDLCSGSGCIPLSLKDERPDAAVHAVELDPHAYAWAVGNRQRLDLDVTLKLGDATNAFPELEGEVDVVVSNPPYIPVGMVPVDPEVRDHDPDIALYGGSPDGLLIPVAVADRALVLLKPGGLLVMEHAETQGESLPAALRRRGWTEVHDESDLAGRPRFVVGRKP